MLRVYVEVLVVVVLVMQISNVGSQSWYLHFRSNRCWGRRYGRGYYDNVDVTVDIER
jgi:hypothetical protein